MARIETDPNYSSPTFSRATAAADLVKKEDVQSLASAISTHDHSTGKGLAVTATGLAATVTIASPTTTLSGGNVALSGTLSVAGAAGVGGALTVTGNGSVLGGSLTLGATLGNQGQLQLYHPNGRAARLRGGAAALEFTNAANSVITGSLDDSGNAVFAGNLTLNSATGTAINFGDCQMISAGSTYIQTNGKLALGVGVNGYRLVLPNTASGDGQGMANAWQVYTCIDHARQFDLNVQPVADALGKVRDLQPYYYDHISFDGEGEPMSRGGGGGELDSTPMYGFSALEVAEVLPEMVGRDLQGVPIAVDYPRMVIVLWAAVQELGARLAALELEAPA